MYCITIYPAHAALDSIDVREIKRRKEMEQRRREKAAAIKRKTFAPKPPVKKRSSNFNADDHKFEAPPKDEAADSSTDAVNATYAAFLKDRYTQKYIASCEPDMNVFNEKYLHLIVHAHGIAQWAYDNRKTLAVGPRKLLEAMLIVFENKMPAGLKDRGREHYTFKFIMYFMRAVRHEWEVERRENHGWKNYDNEDNLWCWFKNWYCDRWIGSLLHQRHHKVKRAYLWYKEEADYSGYFEMHDAPVVTVLEDSLAGLHKFEVRWFRENVKKGDEISDLCGKPKPGKKEYLQHMDLKSSHVLSAQHGASQVLSSAEAEDVMKSAQFEDEVKVPEMKETPREPGVAPEADEYNYSESDAEESEFRAVSKTPIGIPPQYHQPPPLESVKEENDDMMYPDLGKPIQNFYVSGAGKGTTKPSESDMELASLAGGGTEDDNDNDEDSANSSGCLIEPDPAWGQ